MKISLRQEVVPVEIREEDALSAPDLIESPTIPVSLSPAPAAVCIRVRDDKIKTLNGVDNDVIRNTISAVISLC